MAKVVVPGHGRHGSVELIDYAIKLYAKCKKDSFLVISDATLELKFNQILKNAIAITQDSTKYVKIESPPHNLQTR